MRSRIVLVFAIGCFCLAYFIDTAQANLKRYTYSYDIAEIEWQLLNWTAAWRGTAFPAAPFILDRMEYDRITRKISIYLKGDPDLAAQDNLDKSIAGIVSLFSRRFPPDFDQATDIAVYYELTDVSGNNGYVPPDEQAVSINNRNVSKSEKDGQNSVYIEYKDGAFSRQRSEDSSGPAVKAKIPY
jgi:hypothetical protein